MSTPGTGNTDPERRATDDDSPRHVETPTELMDTGRSGAGASSAGRADTGSGTSTGARSGTCSDQASGATRAGNDGGSGDYVPGGYSAEEDTSGDYVPGMYSDPSPEDRSSKVTSTREHTRPTPVAASRESASARDAQPPTQVHTQVAPVTASKAHDDDRGKDRHFPRAATAGAVAGSGSGLPSLEDRKLIHQREKEHFGGMKFGSAFFGWLTATGMFVLLSALVGAIAGAFGYGANLSTSDLASGSTEAQSTGITAAVVLGVILLVSYYAGGYVAGRMARFSGVKQGVAVWLWAVIIAIVLAVVGFIIGNQANVTERFQGLGVPSAQDLTGPGLIGLLVVAAIALVGAILGGLVGMRYHRKIDRTDFDALEDAG
ncbi:YrzE family protein [Arthrobacter bussei]|uniref:YrzE family protein n=1 Tax=Arthrobacter bussei TaxID=2594179 RepID=UPI001F51482A|nr:YrzE family protein [Arthrobacter bussei]